MNTTVIKKNNMPVANWSGGTTTQLFIYPSGSSYEARDFQIRISSATVQQASSNFTLLPDFHRILMPLNAPLTLEFNNAAATPNKITLKPFQSAEFKGSWHTTSYGICTDIGIMLSKKWQASILAGSTAQSKVNLSDGFVGVYSLHSNLKIFISDTISSTAHTLNSGDFLITQGKNISLSLAPAQKNHAIIFLINATP